MHKVSGIRMPPREWMMADERQWAAWAHLLEGSPADLPGPDMNICIQVGEGIADVGIVWRMTAVR